MDHLPFQKKNDFAARASPVKKNESRRATEFGLNGREGEHSPVSYDDHLRELPLL